MKVKTRFLCAGGVLALLISSITVSASATQTTSAVIEQNPVDVDLKSTESLKTTEEPVRVANRITALHYLNNETDNTDYKMPAETVEDFFVKFEADVFSPTGDVNVDFNYDETPLFQNDSSYQDLSSIEAESGSAKEQDTVVSKSYLIQNNIISRPEMIRFEKGKAVVNKVTYQTGKFAYYDLGVKQEGVEDKYVVWGDNDVTYKSDLLMALYKAKYGVINSRIVVLQAPSVRNGSSSGNNTKDYYNVNASTGLPNRIMPVDSSGYLSDGIDLFPEGDFYAYYSPNVYELYFKELLDKGIINRSDFSNSGSGKRFAYCANDLDIDDGGEYVNFSKSRPAWCTDFGYAINRPGALVNGTNSTKRALGSSFVVSDKEDTIYQKKPTYFGKEEKLSTIEALQLVETFMRTTEKDMTELEASIVTYKYGMDYLEDLSDDEKKTVSFLIAKGILNFEDKDLTISLHSTLRNRDFYRILYRVANPEARYDFSEITLTDQESYWQERGYAAENFEVQAVSSNPICETVSVDTEKNDSVAKNVIEKVFGYSINAAANRKNYVVVKRFDTVNTYKYDGVTLSSLKAGGDVVSNELKSVTINGISVSVYETTFRVEATSQKAALNYVNNNIDMKITSKRDYAMSAVTKITTNNNETITLVAQDTLQQAFTDLTVLEDKVLFNNKTGAMACILEDQGYALVGNTVIVSEDLMVTQSDGEVYYNLNIIFSLLSNAFFDNIGKNKVFVLENLNEIDVPLNNSVNGNTEATAQYIVGYTQSNSEVVIADSNGSNSNTGSGDANFFYKVDSITSGINTLVRTFKVPYNNDYKDVTMIVDWNYVVPTADNFNTQNWLSKALTVTSYTVKEAADAFYTPPEEGSLLREWWDSNYGMSNALANFMYGTNGITYIRSGYMAPSVSILMDKSVKGGVASDSRLDTSAPANQLIKDMFVQYGFKIDQKYKKYINNQIEYLNITYFGNPSQHVTDANQGAYCSLAKKRKFKVYKSVNSDSLGTMYGSSYYLSNAGVLYRNVDTDSDRLSVKKTSSGNTLSKIVLQDRIECCNRPVSRSVVKCQDSNGTFRSFVYLGTDKETGYIKLLPEFSNTGKVSDNWLTTDIKISKDGKNIQLTKKKNIKDRRALVEGWYDTYFPKFTQELRKQHNKYWKATLKDQFGSTSSMNLGIGSYFVYGDSSLFAVTRTANKLDYDKIAQKDVHDVYESAKTAQKQVHFVPIFYLPPEIFYIYENSNGVFQLASNSTRAQYLTFSDFFYSGVNTGVIDAILANYTKTVEVGTLKNKMKLVIGDVTWTKSGDFWYSEPIKNTTLVEQGKKGYIGSAIKKFYNVLQINCDGQYYDLNEYFNNIVLASPVKSSAYKKEGLVCMDKSKKRKVYKNGKYMKISTKASYVCVKMKIDKSLLVRPIDAKGSKWTVVYAATNALAGGTEAGIPFFAENLSYNKRPSTSVFIEDSKFSPSALFISQRDAFNALHKEAFTGDVWSLIKMIVLAVAVYLSVMSWIAYGVLTLGVGRFFFEALSIPSSDGKRNGIDFMKVFTFGIFSLDDEPTLVRSCIVILVCMIIIVTILNFI